MLIKDCLRFTFNFYLHIRDVCCWGSLSLLARLSLGCVDGVNDLVEGVGFIIFVSQGEVDSGEDRQDCEETLDESLYTAATRLSGDIPSPGLAPLHFQGSLAIPALSLGHFEAVDGTSGGRSQLPLPGVQTVLTPAMAEPEGFFHLRASWGLCWRWRLLLTGVGALSWS